MRPMQWPDFARLRPGDTVFCHTLLPPYWLREAVVEHVAPPEVSVHVLFTAEQLTPRLERLHLASVAHDATCRYCRAAAGEWVV